MHIEIGILPQDKLVMAAVAATGLLAVHAKPLLTSPANWLRTALAAVFFSILMQLWHLPVGPSELHLVGAIPIYLLFGYIPTLFGFMLGLFLQAFFFEPQDMLHLAVNFLSLGVPLVVVHATYGRHLQKLRLTNLVTLDAFYYTGVTLMVGFWLSISTAGRLGPVCCLLCAAGGARTGADHQPGAAGPQAAAGQTATRQMAAAVLR